jgi:hypothetical protein
MSEPSPAASQENEDRQVYYTATICAEVDITDRCLRKWTVRGYFPAPDGNLNGRNFWLRSTYERWRSDVLAGRYAKHRRPGRAQLKNEPPLAA